MAWRGFLKESKSYMNYPELRGRCYICRPLQWNEIKRIIWFWVRYPIALYKFTKSMKTDIKKGK